MIKPSKKHERPFRNPLICDVYWWASVEEVVFVSYVPRRIRWKVENGNTVAENTNNFPNFNKLAKFFFLSPLSVIALVCQATSIGEIEIVITKAISFQKSFKLKVFRALPPLQPWAGIEIVLSLALKFPELLVLCHGASFLPSSIHAVVVILTISPCDGSSVAKKEAFYSIKEDKDEQKEFETGPLSVLMQSVQQNTQVRHL